MITTLESMTPAARAEFLATLTEERDALREQANAAHAALDEAGAPACDGVLSGRVTALAVDRDRANDFLATAIRERADARADQDAAEHRRNTLYDTVARMRDALSAAGFAAGFSPDEVEQALAAALDAINRTSVELCLCGFGTADTLPNRVRALAAVTQTFFNERDSARAALEEANTTNLRLAGELAQAKVERDKARADHARAAEDLAIANDLLESSALAIKYAGITAPGTLPDKIRALSAFHCAATEASNAKDDRLEAANREIDRLTGQLSDLRGERQEDRAENAALRANIANLARVILDLSGAP